MHTPPAPQRPRRIREPKVCVGRNSRGRYTGRYAERSRNWGKKRREEIGIFPMRANTCTHVHAPMLACAQTHADMHSHTHAHAVSFQAQSLAISKAPTRRIQRRHFLHGRARAQREAQRNLICSQRHAGCCVRSISTHKCKQILRSFRCGPTRHARLPRALLILAVLDGTPAASARVVATTVVGRYGAIPVQHTSKKPRGIRRLVEVTCVARRRRKHQNARCVEDAAFARCLPFGAEFGDKKRVTPTA